MQGDKRLNKEADFIQKAVKGDKEAFGFLYELFTAQILNYFYARTSNYQIAEDLTENVFIKAWTNLPKFGKKKKGLNFRAWLFRIAHNLLVDFYRTQKREQPLDQIAETITNFNPPLFAAENKEEKNQLHRAIKLLDEKSQHVVISRFLIGMSHKETAQSLGLTESNVRVIQFRALNKLKEIIGSDDEY